MFPCLAPTPQGLGEQGDWARAREDTKRRVARLASSLERETVITVSKFSGKSNPGQGLFTGVCCAELDRRLVSYW